jgi:ubiquinone/menaquinone biosynthesis C-methylase UbiE
VVNPLAGRDGGTSRDTGNATVTTQGGAMDRQAWLDQRRAAVLASYDQGAPTYDDHGYPTQAQQDWVARLLCACPLAAKILDASCGTGRYFSMAAAAGHRVVGADQSAAMLAQARERGIAVALDLVRLQELPYAGEFDAVLTIDAMENIPPEDWPLVLANLHRAARSGGLLYLTVEEVDEPVIEEAFTTLTQRGLPAVRGEVIEGDVAGYHYHPGLDRVTGWLQSGGTTDHQRGLQSRRRLGLPPLPAPERQAVTHQVRQLGTSGPDRLEMKTVMTGQAVISLTAGMEDPQNVTVAFLVAAGAAESGRPTVMFEAEEAARLALDGVAAGIACDGCPASAHARRTPSP